LPGALKRHPGLWLLIILIGLVMFAIGYKAGRQAATPEAVYLTNAQYESTG
jgi:hypothetical protein